MLRIPRPVLVSAASGLLALMAACSSSAPAPTQAPVPTPTLPRLPVLETEAPQTPTAVPSPTPLSATATATATPMPSPTPERRPPGGALRTAVPNGPVHFDVHQETSPALFTWGPGLVYDRLFRFDTPPGRQEESAVVCLLCESWEMVDQTTYRVTLRPDARWQNLPPVGGRTVSAADVVFSLERQATPGWPNAALLSNIRRVSTTGPKTVQFDLARPDAEFLEILADSHSVIIAPESVRESGDLLEGPVVGSGPWLWKSTTESSSLFAANGDYFDPVRPGAASLEIAYISAGTQVASLLTGIIDFAELAPQEFDLATSRNTRLRVADVRQSGTGLEFAVNTARGPFGSGDVRNSLFGALRPLRDLSDIWSQDAFVGVGLPLTNPSWLLQDQEVRSVFERFADSPLTPLDPSNRLTIKVGLFDDRYLQEAERVSGAIVQLGGTAVVEQVTTRQFADSVWFGGDYDLFLGSQPPVASLSDYLLSVYHSSGAWNTTGYSSPELDALIEAQAVEGDPAVRRRMVLDIQRLILAGAHRFAPASRVARWVYWPFLEDFNPATPRGDGGFLSAIRVGDRP